MLALFISLLGCAPLAQTLEFDGGKWHSLVTYQLANLLRSLRSLPYHCSLDIVMQQWFEFTGAAVGAWLGAIPIPLDWDRDWQVRLIHTQFWHVGDNITNGDIEMANHRRGGHFSWYRTRFHCWDDICPLPLPSFQICSPP